VIRGLRRGSVLRWRAWGNIFAWASFLLLSFFRWLACKWRGLTNTRPGALEFLVPGAAQQVAIV
jgi:hypothetical protein